ncbi:MAG TPA: ParB/RepB/Spo0J family partition protein [Thermoanaerobaculia bacterium]|nr:ParB/RepB/Spo0J family partition protein [Thermoanaerobaculia bacterium]
MSKKNVLGRGLGALIPQKIESAPGSLEVAVDQITPNPHQPRSSFEDAALEELAESVRVHGIMQPLIVSKSGKGYRLIAGERRFRAAQKAGLKTVPVVIRELVSSSDALELALIENIQREDLNPMEEAMAYGQLHGEFGMTQEEISKRVGKERSTVANVLRLLKLPDRVRALVATGELSMGHARALLAVEPPSKQQKLADQVVQRGLSVRQTEALTSAGAKKQKKTGATGDVFTREAEEKLTRHLRARVEILRRRRGGKVIVHFSGEDELMRIFDELSGRTK